MFSALDVNSPRPLIVGSGSVSLSIRRLVFPGSPLSAIPGKASTGWALDQMRTAIIFAPTTDQAENSVIFFVAYSCNPGVSLNKLTHDKEAELLRSSSQVRRALMHTSSFVELLMW